MPKRRQFLFGGAALAVVRPAAAQPGGDPRSLLASLMSEHRVPGASVAIIRNGSVDERFALGADVDAQFQAASISKVVNGQIVLRLVERGRLSLDAPVNSLLKSWTLPGQHADEVTPRLLLSHRAGTNVPGFPGHIVGTKLPDLRQILDGIPPANTPAVCVVDPPGAAFHYSGGGTMMLQRLVMDVTGKAYAELAHELVLGPVGMARSSYLSPFADASLAHGTDGRPLPGGFHLYPELAAAGLWSTPADLAQLALAIVASPSLRLMSAPVGDGPTGLGIFVESRGARPPWLYHYGVNAGFRSLLAFAADASFGVVLMTNGEGGRPLIPAFMDAVLRDNDQDVPVPRD